MARTARHLRFSVYENETAYYASEAPHASCNDTYRQRTNLVTKAGERSVVRHDIVFNSVNEHGVYGHILIQYLPLVMLTSPEMRKRAYFIVPWRSDYLLKMYKALGIMDDHVIVYEPDKIIFARRLYMLRPVSNQYAWRMAIDGLVKAWNLSHEQPTRYVLYNRRDRRTIANIGEIEAHLNKTFPQIKFEKYSDGARERISCVHLIQFFREIIFLFAMHGSGSFNAMFMQPGSVMCIIETAFSSGRWFVSMNKLFHIHAYITRDWKFPHNVKSRSLPLKELRILELITLAVEKALESSMDWKFDRTPLVNTVPLLCPDGELRVTLHK